VHREHDATGVGEREALEQLRRGLGEAVGIVGADMGVGVEEVETLRSSDLVGQRVEPGAQDGGGIGFHAAATLYGGPHALPA
jgi:hypothetical protein